MRENNMFDNQIRNALHRRVNGIQCDKSGFYAINARLAQGERWQETISRMSGRLFTQVKKPLAICCCAVIMLTMMCVIDPSFKVWATENIQKVSGMIYVAIKGDDNKYDAIRVPAEYTENGNNIEVTTDNSALEFQYKVPTVLKGGYLGAEQTTEGKASRTVSKYYRNGDEQLVLTITQEDWMMDVAKTEGDNKELFTVAGTDVYYYESPDPIYPLIQGEDGLWTFDLTQPPTEIKTNHQVTWAYKGVTYQVSDLGNADADIVKKAAESAIRYQLDK